MPAISRPLLIVLIAAVVALVGFYATQGARNSTSSNEAAAPVVPATPAPDSGATADKAAESPASVAKVDKAKADKPKADPADRGEVAATARKAAATKAAARRRARAERIGMPLSLARALNQRKTVVLLFRGSPSADDRAAAGAVADLRGQRGVAVFSDRIGKLGRYRAVVGDLGISQAPAVVIVDRSRSARVVQGYVDPVTLAQDVADSR